MKKFCNEFISEEKARNIMKRQNEVVFAITILIIASCVMNHFNFFPKTPVFTMIGEIFLVCSVITMITSIMFETKWLGFATGFFLGLGVNLIFATNSVLNILAAVISLGIAIVWTYVVFVICMKIATSKKKVGIMVLIGGVGVLGTTLEISVPILLAFALLSIMMPVANMINIECRNQTIEGTRSMNMAIYGWLIVRLLTCIMQILETTLL